MCNSQKRTDKKTWVLPADMDRRSNYFILTKNTTIHYWISHIVLKTNNNSEKRNAISPQNP